jgi:hypothetical protein
LYVSLNENFARSLSFKSSLSLSCAIYSTLVPRKDNKTKKKNKKNTQTRARALFSVFFFEKCGRWWVRFVVWSAYKETLFFFSWCVLWGARKAQKERKYLSTGNLNSIQNPKLLFSAKMELMCSPQRTYHLLLLRHALRARISFANARACHFSSGEKRRKEVRRR